MRIVALLALSTLFLLPQTASARFSFKSLKRWIPGAARSKAARRAPSWLTNKQRPIAHRGLHDARRPENAMSAFRAAVARGLPIELDVHLLADGKVAVFHDKTLDRMTGVAGKIKDVTSRDLGRYRLKGSNEPIPMLNDVLSMVNGRVPVLVELKGKTKKNGLEQAVWHQLSRYGGKVAVMAFSPGQMKWFRKNAPQVSRGQLASNFKAKKDMSWHSKVISKSLLVNLWSRPDFIGYDIKALPTPAVTLVRKLGKKPIIGWTIRTQQDVKRAAPHIDGFIAEGAAVDAITRAR